MESFHGNIEKVGRAQIGGRQSLEIAQLGRTLQFRKEVVRPQVLRSQVNASEYIGAEIFRSRIVSAEAGEKIVRKKGLCAEIFRPKERCP